MTANFHQVRMQLMSTTPLRLCLPILGLIQITGEKHHIHSLSPGFIEGATLVTYLFLKMKISANFTTLMYIFCGFFGSVIIAFSSNYLVYLGMLMVFCKGVFDWADGQIARWNNEESLGGHLLDCYGAKVNAICFSAALGFYSFRETEQIIYLYFLVGFVLSALSS